MSAQLALAESLLQAGNAAAAYRILMDFPEQGVKRDVLLARCALRLGDPPRAVVALTAALGRDSRHAEAASLLGELYLRLGWLDKAEALFTKFLKKTDDDTVRAYFGYLLFARKRADAALAEFDRVLARRPDHALALQYRGDVRASTGRRAEAVEDYQRLLQLQPGRADVFANLGTVEHARGRHDEAVASLREALARQPGNAAWLATLALAQTMGGRIEEARMSLARLRELDLPRWQALRARMDLRCDWAPEAPIDPRPCFLQAAFDRFSEADWSLRDRYDEVFRDLLRAPQGNPMGMVHNAGIARLSLEERLRLGELSACATGAGIEAFRHAPAPAPERLRVAYLLPYLGAHVVAWILQRLVAAHDCAAVEVFLVSCSMEARDYQHPTLAFMRALPGVTWVDVTTLDDATAAARIHGLGLDVLVDLAVYNDRPRPALMARRPAPVQVSWLGAPYSSGAPWLDYLLSDPVVSPGRAGWCSEAEVKMPSCYFVFGPAEDVPAPMSRAEAGLPEQAFVFSALHNPYKLDPETFDCWLRILAAAPDSVLWLKEGEGLRTRLRARAVAAGVDPARLVFAPHVPFERYLARQGVGDLLLDTSLYNGHTTIAESLWMGVPALTCPGEAFHSRVGASLLTSCGLQDLVMPDWASYEATAIALYDDRPRLMALRERLAVNRARSAPFDMAAQARVLEKACRHMRQRFANGLPPVPFDIAGLPG